MVELFRGALPLALVFPAMGAQLGWHIRAPALLGAPTSFMGVAYGGGLFVAVAYDGTIAISSDAANWQTNVPPGAVPWTGVAYANGRFLAVGGIPAMLISSVDGTVWVEQPFPDVHALPTGLSSTGDRFWLCGKSGLDRARELFTSTTGSNWVRSAGEFFELADGAYISVASSGGLYACVGWDTSSFGVPRLSSAPTILISADRTNWTTEVTGVDRADPDRVADGTGLRKVTYGDNLFIAVGNNNGRYLGAGRNIWYSADGIRWNYELTSFPDLASITYGDGVYVAVGGGEALGDPGVILTSMDGQSWSAAPISSTNKLTDVVFAQNTFVVVGNYGQIFQSDLVVTLKANYQPGQMLVHAPLGRTCTIEASTRILPTSVWRPVGTAVITNNPTLWTDYLETNRVGCYYRVRLEP